MWHTLDLTEVVRKLRSNINYGITNEEAKIRLEKYGKNTIHLFVRKIFGHFGAFMVCSFFALMTMIFFLKNNYP